MSLATVAWDARARRRVAAATIAAALQGIFYWLILHEAIKPTALPSSTPLEVSLISVTRRPRLLPRQGRRRVTRSAGFAPRKQAPPPARSVTVAQPARPELDWQEAMQDEVRAEEFGRRTRKLQFGFPQRPAPFAAAPAFGWDYAHTHRVQGLPTGGVLIMLNEHCALVIFVMFPIVGCKIGKIPANGQLFQHIHAPGNDRPGGLP